MYYLPGREKGKWEYIRVNGRCLDKAKFEEFKTRFYNLEEWDTRSGWPKRITLESLGLKFVADELQQKGKLGT
jgi:aldehyde:ferredoxin oxidoreductase